MELKINIIAVLVAVAVNFVIGFIWYTPLFGKIWGKEMGYDPNIKPDGKTMAKGMTLMVIGNLLFAWVFACALAGWQFIPGIKEMAPFRIAIHSAVMLWLGFYLPGHLGAIIWEKKSWKLFGINTGYNLVSLLVVAFILTYWT
jgi:hypothetical protein